MQPPSLCRLSGSRRSLQFVTGTGPLRCTRSGLLQHPDSLSVTSLCCSAASARPPDSPRLQRARCIRSNCISTEPSNIEPEGGNSGSSKPDTASTNPPPTDHHRHSPAGKASGPPNQPHTSRSSSNHFEQVADQPSQTGAARSKKRSTGCTPDCEDPRATASAGPQETVAYRQRGRVGRDTQRTGDSSKTRAKKRSSATAKNSLPPGKARLGRKGPMGLRAVTTAHYMPRDRPAGIGHHAAAYVPLHKWKETAQGLPEHQWKCSDSLKQMWAKWERHELPQLLHLLTDKYQLSPEDAASVLNSWAQSGGGPWILFKAANVAAWLNWFEADVGLTIKPRFLRRIHKVTLRPFAFAQPDAQAVLEVLRKELSASDEAVQYALDMHPDLLCIRAIHLQDTLHYLVDELGISKQQVLFGVHALSCSMSKLRSAVECLQSCGFTLAEVKIIVSKRPNILVLSNSSLQGRLHYLTQELGLNKDQLVAPVGVLHTPLQQLQSTLTFLRSLHFTMADVQSFVMRDPTCMALRVGGFQAKISLRLQNLDLSKHDIQAIQQGLVRSAGRFSEWLKFKRSIRLA